LAEELSRPRPLENASHTKALICVSVKGFKYIGPGLSRQDAEMS
jgi:hypothetical protein